MSLISKFFNRNKVILDRINADEKVIKCCSNCEYKRRAGAVLNTYKCVTLNTIINNQWVCDNHKFSKEFINLYTNNIKANKANLIKRAEERD